MQNISDVYAAGRSFELNKSTKDRKQKGVFYTPEQIVDFMVEEALKGFDPVSNPQIKILDPACGAGYFLLKVYYALYNKFSERLEAVIHNNESLGTELSEDNLGVFIAENCIWGADVDPEAVALVKEQIAAAVGKPCRVNITCCDSIVDGKAQGTEGKSTDMWHNRYHLIIGNPPYIGHKGVSIEYKKQLQQLYQHIYRDKSDISYCFIKRGIDLLDTGGRLSFIVSRYFMQGPSAAGLRKYISDNCTVISIFDFFGSKVFGDAGVDVCILTLEKGVRPIDTEVTKYEQNNSNAEAVMDSLAHNTSYCVKQSQLENEGWMLIPQEQHEVFRKLHSQGTHSLDELFHSHQGIITGCDKAFVVDEETIEKYGLERALLKPWIKNSDVDRYSVKTPKYSLIYSDMIENIEEYPNAIGFIDNYRSRLANRRECLRGFRKWYQLQWGRRKELFESKKIVYPYKSSTNRFAIDTAGYFCSADVYSLILKEHFSKQFEYDYLCALLNSKLVEFYFKCYAKKMSGNLYDYYPNTILRIRLQLDDPDGEIQNCSKQLLLSKDAIERRELAGSIDKLLYGKYSLSDKQIEIIEKEVGDSWV